MLWGQRKKNPFWLPKQSKTGLIDYKSIFQLVYCELKQPYGILDEMTVSEVSWLIEGHSNSQKDYYEMISYAVKNAMVSVNKGKDMKMFEEEKKQEQKLTTTEKETEMEALKSIFSEL